MENQKDVNEEKVNVKGNSIKVCPDPGCDAVWHNCPDKQTKCLDCDGRVIRINENTYWKKFENSFFQYDFITREFYRPVKSTNQLTLEF
jgi:hypothetical protein